MIDYSKITIGDERVEVLRITKEGITANPDVPTDEAASAVIRALDVYIKNLVNRPWVGLTDEDKLHIEIIGGKSDVMLAETIEAKLKQKNGYNA